MIKLSEALKAAFLIAIGVLFFIHPYTTVALTIAGKAVGIIFALVAVVYIYFTSFPDRP